MITDLDDYSFDNRIEYFKQFVEEHEEHYLSHSDNVLPGTPIYDCNGFIVGFRSYYTGSEFYYS
jgi:hypothetical protein